jgi:hypothetical protein
MAYVFLTHFLKPFRSGFPRFCVIRVDLHVRQLIYTGNSLLGLKNWNGICLFTLFTSIRIDKEYSQLLNNICRVVQTKGIIL